MPLQVTESQFLLYFACVCESLIDVSEYVSHEKERKKERWALNVLNKKCKISNTKIVRVASSTKEV
jgi:ribosomal protein L28